MVSASRKGVDASGFRLMPSGPHALATRFALTRSAETSIDLQYFIFQRDSTGLEFLRLIRDAALRGVRVRILLDDLYFAGSDELFLGLMAFNNVQVRLFNPFRLRNGGPFIRFASSPLDFERLNHRMHNKLFIVDGSFAITGGRNIGDEYFSRRDAGNFIDLDVLAAGEIVQRFSSDFDLYWNSLYAVPLDRLAVQSLSADALRKRFDEQTMLVNAPADDYQDIPDVLGRESPAREIAAGHVEMAWGEAESYADLPGKGNSSSEEGEYGSNLVRLGALEHIRSAKTEVLLTSPYFIPGSTGVDLFSQARRRGVNVNILTNSLSSSDQPIVHASYRRYRHALLAAGIRLFELSPNRAGSALQRHLFGLSAGGLHTKSLIIDQEQLFIGSMNFDPRSDHFNTENGLAIHIPVIAREAARLTALAEAEAAHEVRIARDGHLEWITAEGAIVNSHDNEPETSLWLRFWLRVLSPLAPESLL